MWGELREQGRVEIQLRLLVRAVSGATAWEPLEGQDEEIWLLLHLHLPSHSQKQSERWDAQNKERPHCLEETLQFQVGWYILPNLVENSVALEARGQGTDQ